jgi:hypothetical protein
MAFEELRGLIEAVVAGASILGGAMAYETGFAAARAVARGASPAALSWEINRGVARGFMWGSPLAAFAPILVGWN